jgi:hypothetical protein
LFARHQCLKISSGHDYFVACSCKGRDGCPSYKTRRMVDTAARLTDHGFLLEEGIRGRLNVT